MRARMRTFIVQCSVGMLFLPNDDKLEEQSRSILEAILAKEGLTLLGYRAVPVKHEVVGRFAKATQPRIMQVRGRGVGGGRGRAASCGGLLGVQRRLGPRVLVAGVGVARTGARPGGRRAAGASAGAARRGRMGLLASPEPPQHAHTAHMINNPRSSSRAA